MTTSPTVLAGCKWAGAGEFKPERYIITANEGKGRKFSGMKSFTTYEISTESSNVSVERRFKHFTWFRDQLQRIYPFVTVPPIPEKQLKGRFSSDFVQQRCQGLQQFLNRLAVHPVLHDAAVVKHFLSATEQKEWKSGKRLAEQQPVFLGTLVLKDGPATVGKNQGELDNLITQSSQFAVWLQDNLGKWNNAGESMGTHFQELSASYQKMSETVKTFDAVADGLRFKTWWSTEDSCPVNELMGSLANLGTTMEHVGIMMSQHNEVQMGSLISALNEYSSLVKAIPVRLVLRLRARLPGVRACVRECAGMGVHVHVAIAGARAACRATTGADAHWCIAWLCRRWPTASSGRKTLMLGQRTRWL